MVIKEQGVYRNLILAHALEFDTTAPATTQ